MKLQRLVLTAVALMTLVGYQVPSWAGTRMLQSIFDDRLGAGELNAETDALADGTDARWTAQSGASATLQFELARFAPDNVFGIYDPSAPSVLLPLFRGAASDGAETTLTIDALGGGFRFSVTSGGSTESALFGTSVFGFYLSTPQSNSFFSETARNSDHFDHLRAYHTDSLTRDVDYVYPEGSYLLAWEDLLNGGDKDFDDFVVAMNGYVPVGASAASPVPLPAGILLFGSGLLGLAGLGRRKMLKQG